MAKNKKAPKVIHIAEEGDEFSWCGYKITTWDVSADMPYCHKCVEIMKKRLEASNHALNVLATFYSDFVGYTNSAYDALTKEWNDAV